MTEHRDQDHSPQRLAAVYLSVSRAVVVCLCAGTLLGAVVAIASQSLYSNGLRRMLLAYLVAFAFALSLSLGSIFIVLIQHLTRAGWSVLVRRPAEVFSLNILTVALLFAPIGWSVWQGGREIYPWAGVSPAINGVGPRVAHDRAPGIETEVALLADSAQAAHTTTAALEQQVTHGSAGGLDTMYAHQTMDELTSLKSPWLNSAWYLFRMLCFFGVWVVIAAFYFRQSQLQDVDGDAQQTRRMERCAGPALFAFGLTLTFAAFDLLMSLDPHWYSTIFGVYFFAGCAIGGFAVNLLTLLLLSRCGIFPKLISNEHRRDLGRLLFAFVFFWGYIAFSQYMLLWYANVPETTRWFVVRGASMAVGYRNSWGYLLIFLLFGQFLIPFLGIISRHVKGNQNAMIFWTIWLLAMHYLDLYWLVMPELGPQFTIGPVELGTILAVACIYLLGASVIATRTSLIPIGDPRLFESLRVTEAY